MVSTFIQILLNVKFKNDLIDFRGKAPKGHYYENHNIENQKEHPKICEPSLHQKSPLK
jgi:hypothetical protein